MIDIDRLRLSMEEQGLSQSALAAVVGVSPAAIQQILNGKTRVSRAMPSIAKALGVSIEWLSGESDQKFTAPLAAADGKEINPVVLPYLSAPSEQSVSFLVFESTWAKRVFDHSGGTDTVLQHVLSREMAPTLLPGDDIAINKDGQYDGNGETIRLIDVGGRFMVRRVRQKGDGVFLVVADNPLYPTFEAKAEEIRILGRVVWQGRPLIA